MVLNKLNNDQLKGLLVELFQILSLNLESNRAEVHKWLLVINYCVKNSSMSSNAICVVIFNENFFFYTHFISNSTVKSINNKVYLMKPRIKSRNRTRTNKLIEIFYVACCLSLQGIGKKDL